MGWPNNFGDSSSHVKYLTRKNLFSYLKNRKRFFLFLDYDGTLSPIVKEPRLAKISPRTKNILEQLSRKKSFLVGIISGRSLRDIKQRVGIEGIAYAGNHGLELEYKGKKITQVIYLKYKQALKKAKPQLKKALKDIKGVILEDKGLSLAVHYRKISQKEQANVIKIFRKAAEPWLNQKLFKIGEGKKVIELKPDVDFNKAQAVNFFEKKLKKSRNDLTIFAGDDLTDEDVFKRLNSKELGICIGRKKSSKARYFLKDTQDLARKLRDILTFITPSHTKS